MGIEVDKPRTTFIVQKALGAMDSQQGLFSEGVFRPEGAYIEMVKNLGEQLGKSEFASNAVFLTTALVFGDDTGKFFKRITDREMLNKYAWIFDPKAALKKSDAEIMAGCTEFFRPAGYNKNVILEWSYNLRLLEQEYGGDIRNFFNKQNGDIEKILRALTVRPRAKTSEKREKRTFTRYGPKIASLLIQWINQYNLYEFGNSNSGAVPVDFQVARVLIQTGAVQLNQPENAHQVTTIVGRILQEACSQSNLEPRRVSEALWNIGSRGCNQKNHKNCPLEQFCDRLISRRPYDASGQFDPKDTGRWEEELEFETSH